MTAAVEISDVFTERIVLESADLRRDPWWNDSMSTVTILPQDLELLPELPVWRFTVEDYARMGEIGVLTEDHRVELLEGLVVPKMIHGPAHDNTIELIEMALDAIDLTGWRHRTQSAITTIDSAPEPDVALVSGGPRDRAGRHPIPDEIGLVIEVADSSLARDRGPKARLYARAEIPTYWIVNLIDRQVEFCTEPTGPGAEPKYVTTTTCKPGEEVPVVLDGVEVGRLKVDDLLP